MKLSGLGVFARGVDLEDGGGVEIFRGGPGGPVCCP